MTLAELITKLGFEVDTEGIQKAEQSMENLRKKAVWAVAGIGAAFAGLSVVGLKAASDIESLNAELATMLGSLSQAEKLNKGIQKFAIATPYSSKEIAQNAKTLLSFRVPAEQVMDSLQMIGDVAGRDVGKFNALSLAFARVQSMGKMSGREFQQMVMAGFNPLAEISEKTGKSMSTLQQEMAKGAISADMVTEAFKRATSEGGMFFGNMKRQSETLSGKLAILGGTLQETLAGSVMMWLPSIKRGLDMVIEGVNGAVTSVGEAIGNAVRPLWVMGLMVGQVLTMLTDRLRAELIPTAMEGQNFLELMAFRLGEWLNANNTAVVEMIDLIIAVFKVAKSVLGMGIKAVLVFGNALMLLTPRFETINRHLDLLGSLLFAIFATMALQRMSGFITALQGIVKATAAWVMQAKANLTIQKLTAQAYWAQLNPLQALKAGIRGVGGALKGLSTAVPHFAVVTAAIAALTFGLKKLHEATIGDKSFGNELEQEGITEAKQVAERIKATESAIKAAQSRIKDSREQISKGDTRYEEDLKSDQKELQRLNMRLSELRSNLSYSYYKDKIPQEFSVEDFTRHLDLLNKDFGKMQTESAGGLRTTNIYNDIDLEMNVPTDDNGRTKLSAAGVGRAMEEAARSVFSVELQRVLVRSV